MSQIILYCRVSSLEQTIAHQEAQARAAGFAIDHVIEDHGVSGVNTKLADRPNGRRLYDMLRRGDVLVVSLGPIASGATMPTSPARSANSCGAALSCARSSTR